MHVIGPYGCLLVVLTMAWLPMHGGHGNRITGAAVLHGVPGSAVASRHVRPTECCEARRWCIALQTWARRMCEHERCEHDTCRGCTIGEAGATYCRSLFGDMAGRCVCSIVRAPCGGCGVQC
jgi:hypothetical protein